MPVAPMLCEKVGRQGRVLCIIYIEENKEKNDRYNYYGSIL